MLNNYKNDKKELLIMAKRIIKKLCPYCWSDNIKIDLIWRSAKCNECEKSMWKEEWIKLLRRSEIKI